MNRKNLFVASCLALICLGCGGSRGPEIATVEGTVTMDGEPLAGATVVFMPENGRPAGARTDEDGHYVLNFSGDRQGAMPGKNRVRITTMSDPWEDADGTRHPGSAEKVPDQFNRQSTLEFTVEEGKVNIADFDITSEGSIGVTEVEE